MRCWTCQLKKIVTVSLHFQWVFEVPNQPTLNPYQSSTSLKTASVHTSCLIISSCCFLWPIRICWNFLLSIDWMCCSLWFSKVQGVALGEKSCTYHFQKTTGENPPMLLWWNSWTIHLPITSWDTPATVGDRQVQISSWLVSTSCLPKNCKR